MPEENIPTEQPAQPTTEVVESVAPTGTVETPAEETGAPTATIETVDPRVSPAELNAGSPEDDSKKLGGDDLIPASTPAPVLETAPTETMAGETVAPSVENGQETPLPAPVADAIENGHDTPLPANSAGTPPKLGGDNPPAPPAPIFSPIKNLLLKAKEKIQWRKRQKLEKIVKLAGEKGKITNDQVQKMLRVSDATATRYLTQLVKEGRLIREGKTKKPTYRLP